MDLGGWGNREDLEQVGGRGTLIETYCLEKPLFSIYKLIKELRFLLFSI